MKTIIAAIIITIVISSVLTLNFPYYAINPGIIPDYHKAMQNDCNKCHTPVNGSQKKCLNCHKINSIGISDSINIKHNFLNLKITTLHQNLKSKNCEICHIEHINSVDFKNHLKFNHVHIQEKIQSKCEKCHISDKPNDNIHNSLDNCIDCHTTTVWSIDNFNHDKKILNGTECIVCHKNNKPDDLIHKNDGKCSECHSTKEWKPSHFDHADHFVFDEDHPNKCSNCHTDKSTFKVYSCYNCHEHEKSKLLAEHAEEGIYNIDNCKKCHNSGNKHEVKEHKRESKERKSERHHDNEDND
jgi:hypothetical protein